MRYIDVKLDGTPVQMEPVVIRQYNNLVDTVAVKLKDDMDGLVVADYNVFVQTDLVRRDKIPLTPCRSSVDIVVEEGYLGYTWPIDSAVTRYKGVLQFEVQLEHKTDAAIPIWQSEVCKLITVAPNICDNTALGDDGPAILQEVYQQLQTLEDQAEQAAASAADASESKRLAATSATNAAASNQNAASAAVTALNAKIANDSTGDLTDKVASAETVKTLDGKITNLATNAATATDGQILASNGDGTSEFITQNSDLMEEGNVNLFHTSARVNTLIDAKTNNFDPKLIQGASIPFNLINLLTLTEDYYVNETTGNLVASISYAVTDYIPIKPSTYYRISVSARHAFYTSSKVYISGSFGSIDANSPANAAFIRVSVHDDVRNKIMLTETNFHRSVYYPYRVYLPQIEVRKENIRDIPEIKPWDIVGNGVVRSVNLYNLNAGTDGYYIESTHPGAILQANAIYTTSEYIPVLPATNYTVSHRNRYACYDIYKKVLSAADLSTLGVSTFTTPANTAYVRMSLLVSNKETYMISQGDSVPATYTKFGVVVPWIIQDSAELKSLVGYKKSKYEGKTMVCFGDSITYGGYSTTIAADTGMTVINQGYSSGRIAPETDPVKNAFGLYNLVYSIATGDWTIPDTIIGVSGYSTHEAQLAILKTINFNNVNFVTFAYGTNDWSSSTSITDNTSDLYDYTNIIGAFRYCVKTLLDEYPNLRILILTPIYRFFLDVDGTTILSDSDTKTNTAGYTIPTLVERIKNVGKELHLPVVDMYNELGINAHNRLKYFANPITGVYDGTHPRPLGTEIMGHKIAGAITTLY